MVLIACPKSYCELRKLLVSLKLSFSFEERTFWGLGGLSPTIHGGTLLGYLLPIPEERRTPSSGLFLPPLHVQDSEELWLPFSLSPPKDVVVLYMEPVLISNVNAVFHRSQEVYFLSFSPNPLHPKDRVGIPWMCKKPYVFTSSICLLSGDQMFCLQLTIQ